MSPPPPSSGRATTGDAAKPGPEAVDVAVVGSGPNGLAAAITAARAGRSVVVLEAADEPGGATRTAPVLGDGYRVDVGSAVHPLAVASPFLRTIPWAEHGLEWITPPVAAAHPLDGGRAGIVWNDLNRTAVDLGPDAKSWRSLYTPLVNRFDELIEFALGPPLPSVARHPLTALRVGPQLATPASLLVRRFEGETARALLAGYAAHSVLPLTRPFTGGFGALFGASAHAVGWPFPRGGAAEISRVLVEVLEGLGGRVVTGHPVASLDDVPPAGAVVFALTPPQVEAIVGDALPRRARRRFRRFPFGPGACKLDLAVSEPIPWANPDVALTGTVHLGGTFEEVAAAEQTVADGGHAERPYVLLAQPSGLDPSRAPDGHHVIWAYCHVPNGSTVDVSETIVAQIERFAPGFRDTIVARHVSLPADLERGNANLVGGDIGGGSYAHLRAILRPGLSPSPHDTAVDRFFIGSASTSPGAGVHGMAGHLAATRALTFLDRGPSR